MWLPKNHVYILLIFLSLLLPFIVFYFGFHYIPIGHLFINYKTSFSMIENIHRFDRRSFMTFISLDSIKNMNIVNCYRLPILLQLTVHYYDCFYFLIIVRCVFPYHFAKTKSHMTWHDFVQWQTIVLVLRVKFRGIIEKINNKDVWAKDKND